MSDFEDLLDTPVDEIQKPDRSEEHRQQVMARRRSVTHQIAQPPIKADSAFQLIDLETLQKKQPPKWLVSTILTEGSFNLLFGAPGVGKSFVALSLALSLAYDVPWLTKEVEHGSVVYIAAEGLLGMNLRIPAFVQHYELQGSPPIFFVEGTLSLTDEKQAKELTDRIIAAKINPKLIVVDTLARTFGDGDENQAKDMNKYIRGIDLLRETTKAAVLVLHHTVKSNSRQERGSGALRGAADTIICVEGVDKEGNELPQKIMLTCEKMKDADEFEAIPLILRKVTLESGSTSLIPELTDGAFVKSDGTKNLQPALDILAGFGAVGVLHNEFRQAFEDKTGLKKSSFDRVLKNHLKGHPLVRESKSGKSVRYFYVPPKSVSVSD